MPESIPHNYLLMILTLFLFFSISSANLHACNQKDRNSLLSLPFNTSASPSLNWSATDCCHWEGISCDHKGRVTHISLPSKGLEGSVSPFLGNLTSLSHLNLSHNSLSDSLPLGFFSSLNQLEVLDLSHNHLVGNISLLFSPNGSWPASIRTIDISNNEFNGWIQSSFLQQAWNLIELNVCKNSFQGPIPSSPCINSPNLRLLDFSGNNHSGEIPRGLGGCSKLKIFRAGFNSLTKSLPHDMYSATALEEISIPSNYLSGSINDGIVNLTKLSNLDLSDNKFGGKLPLDFAKLSNLKHLHLRNNFLTGSLPPSLMNCTNLIQLDLRNNSLEGNISNLNFSSLQQLTILDLGFNNFTGNFPASLLSCKSLRGVRISHNRLEGQIPPEVAQLRHLSFFSVSFNRLTNFTSAIKILMHCKRLDVVLMGHNFLQEMISNDDINMQFASNGFKNLRFLDLSEGQLTGQFPIWISKLKKLEILNLNTNRITGPIPGWLPMLPRLISLQLSDNLISSEFPKELCALPALVSAQYLGDNSSFLLPIFNVNMNRWLHQYNSINNWKPNIVLRNNSLSGHIPVEIARLKQLRTLDLSHNSFSGNIPSQISELTNLEDLDLSENQLSGEIPASLTSLNFLHNLSVAGNKLHGEIPSGTQLQSFDASAYKGNPGLCGDPLPKCGNLTRDMSRDKDIHDEEDGDSIPWFHIIVALGFITGFCGVCGPLVLHHK
ncbi:receptor-like protein 3 [Juglans regia]|uniref:Receptor-like protein 3 n=1 Tax=Juglans regia TaxID=51240 RepID=A0A6P9E6X2_JUGRE|nr:receptor-like protein 3 [Juglans regia]XP_035543136.1 receptor-like protein 3 [Juglans regia]